MKKRQTKLTCEVLEGRSLPSITLSDAGVLSVVGTDNAEQIIVKPVSININPIGTLFRPGIQATRASSTGSVIETQSFLAWNVTSLSITARGGNDLIANDTALPATIAGGAGHDSILGGSGADVVDGGLDKDILIGNGGHDSLTGGAGADSLDGGAGNDSLQGNGGADSRFGGLGNDVLRGSTGNDVLLGGRGSDSLTGDGGVDWLLGGSSTDFLQGGDSVDFMFGDTPSADIVAQMAYPRDATVPAILTSDVLADGGIAGRDTMFGGAGNDVMDGEEGDDWLDGGDGDDLMFGDLGKDLLAGVAGSDLMDAFLILTDSFDIPASEAGEVNEYIYELGDAYVGHGDGLWTITTHGLNWVLEGLYEGYLSVTW